MPPAETPEQETKSHDDVVRVLREVRALRIELRQFSEDIMKISELSSSVDRLISAATNVKHQAAAQPAAQPDDPAIQEMYDKIERAIAVLEGRDSGEPAKPPEAPNFPPPDALATDINSPRPQDPNAPV